MMSTHGFLAAGCRRYDGLGGKQPSLRSDTMVAGCMGFGGKRPPLRRTWRQTAVTAVGYDGGRVQGLWWQKAAATGGGMVDAFH